MNLTKNDLLGVDHYDEARIAEVVDLEKYGLDPTEVEFALEGLSYFILHCARQAFYDEERFASQYEQSGLKP